MSKTDELTSEVIKTINKYIQDKHICGQIALKVQESLGDMYRFAYNECKKDAIRLLEEDLK